MNKLFTFIIIVFTVHFLTSVAFATTELTITDNGSNSSNTISLDQPNTTVVNQNNNMNVDNTVSQSANTGNNSASNNNAEVKIDTGDIKTEVDIKNSGNTSTVTGTCCPEDNNTLVTITGNGDHSTNTATIDNSNITKINVNNIATIKNNISGSANTGDNTANYNNGDTKITTGNISVDQKIINSKINNTKVTYTISAQGSVEIKVAGNGDGSVNIVNVDNSSNEHTSINNKLDVLNLSNWFSNTGSNIVKGNNGEVIISTGDIKTKTFIATFETNTSSSDSFCCNENPDYPSQGGENPNDHPGNPNNPTTGIGGNTSGGNSGGSSGSNNTSSSGSVLGLATGSILPATGSFWTMWLTILAGILFMTGLYLRLNPQNAPNRRLVSPSFY